MALAKAYPENPGTLVLGSVKFWDWGYNPWDLSLEAPDFSRGE